MNQPDTNEKAPEEKAPERRPTFTEMANQRIRVLEDAISALNSRTEGRPKTPMGLVKRRDKHLAEMAELKKKLAQDELHANKIGEYIDTMYVIRAQKTSLLTILASAFMQSLG
jgi:hypothetical protein